MYIHEYMSTDVITVTQDTPLYVAQTLMRDHNIRRLPTVDEEGKLVGLVTERKMREAIASLASSVAAGELHKSLTSLTVGDVMEKNVLTISPDAPLAEAGDIGRKKRVGALPVVDMKGKLVGIITTTDLLRVLASVVRFGEPGARLHLVGTTERGELAEVIQVIDKHHAQVKALFHIIPRQVKKEELVIHIDTEDVTLIEEELKARGYSVNITSH